MIKDLRNKIFWIVELLPLSVVFLVLVCYNISYSSYILSDQTKALDYCAECIDQNSATIDKYFYLPVNDLVEVSNDRIEGSNKVKNLLYAIISSDVCVIKLSKSGEILTYTGDFTRKAPPQKIVKKLNSGRSGKVRLNKMAYRIVDKGTERYVILLNTSDWHVEIRKTVLLSLGALAFAALLLAFVARYLSRKITLPILDALAKQNRFIADASHELKTPVAVINANISVLELEYGENKWMRYIKDEGHKMTTLINELLSLCRVDYETDQAIEKKQHLSSFEANDLILETALPFDSIAFEKNAILSIESSGSYICKGNADDFKKILSILLDNAISHTDHGGQITISAEPAYSGSLIKKVKKLYVKVTNTGSVISAEDLPNIFDRFYKARNSNSISPSGSSNFGLGLSIAKALADKNEFNISASSADQTTTFTLSLILVS